jgi:uncharacterized protein (TIGR02246 family)
MVADLYPRTVLVIASILVGSVYPGRATPQSVDTCNLRSATIAQDDVAIRNVLGSYKDALNGGKTAAVLPLYADDGVFMAPLSQSAVGKDAIKLAYDAVFAELKFHVKFAITELVVMAPTWAYVRTNSAGTTDHHSTGKTTAEANQELFIFKQDDSGKWRIARYSFSPTGRQGT